MTRIKRPLCLAVFSFGVVGMAACPLPPRVQYFAPCTDDAACGAGYVCASDSVCVPDEAEPEPNPSPPVDAGEVDAGRVLDAGHDAGADGGPDAGVVDAGLADAGLADAGLVDGGLVDAGPLDAGLVDAGVVDAGVVDAGPIDAGPIDAGPPPGPWSFVDDTATFALGTFQETIVGTGLELAPMESQGGYESRVFMADNPNAASTSLSFVTSRPVGRPLPSGISSAIEQESYANGGADLTDVVMLLQFDSAPRALVFGDAVADSSPIGNEVVLVDNPPLANSRIEAGKVGGGVFIAFEDYLDVRSAVTDPAWAFSPGAATGDFTYSVWMKADECASAGESNLIALGGEDPHIWIGIDCPDGNPTIRVTNGPSGNGESATGTELTDDGQWHHLVGLRRSSTSRIELYVDGALSASTVMAPGPLEQFDDAVFLGNFPIGSPPLWTYKSALALDEVLVLRRAISLGEVFALYTRGATSLRAQIRGCPTASCDGVDYIGPDGTSATSFAADDDATVGPPLPFSVDELGPYFQYRLDLARDQPGLPLAVDSVVLDAAVSD